MHSAFIPRTMKKMWTRYWGWQVGMTPSLLMSQLMPTNLSRVRDSFLVFLFPGEPVVWPGSIVVRALNLQLQGCGISFNL